jgi:hypothetical protein
MGERSLEKLRVHRQPEPGLQLSHRRWRRGAG